LVFKMNPSSPLLIDVIAGGTTFGNTDNNTGTLATFDGLTSITGIFASAIAGGALNPFLASSNVGIPYAYITTDWAAATVRMIVASGTHAVTTFIGSAFACGSADGQGLTARLCNPISVRVDSINGWAAIADRGICCYKSVTWSSSLGAMVSTAAGQCGSCASSAPSNLTTGSAFCGPTAILPVPATPQATGSGALFMTDDCDNYFQNSILYRVPVTAAYMTGSTGTAVPLTVLATTTTAEFVQMQWVAKPNGAIWRGGLVMYSFSLTNETASAMIARPLERPVTDTVTLVSECPLTSMFSNTTSTTTGVDGGLAVDGDGNLYYAGGWAGGVYAMASCAYISSTHFPSVSP